MKHKPWHNCLCLVTDRRTFKDRRDVWAIEKQKTDFVAERPKAKIKQVDSNAEAAPARKPRRPAAAPEKQKSEEHTDDLVIEHTIKNPV